MRSQFSIFEVAFVRQGIDILFHGLGPLDWKGILKGKCAKRQKVSLVVFGVCVLRGKAGGRWVVASGWGLDRPGCLRREVDQPISHFALAV